MRFGRLRKTFLILLRLVHRSLTYAEASAKEGNKGKVYAENDMLTMAVEE